MYIPQFIHQNLQTLDFPMSSVVRFENVSKINQSIHDLIIGYIRNVIGTKSAVPKLIYSWSILYYHSMHNYNIINVKESVYDPTEYRIPRSFKLIMEMEDIEKGKYHTNDWNEDCNHVALSPLIDSDDDYINLSNWHADFIPYQGGYIGDRIYTLKVKVPDEYPDAPPIIKFNQKVAMACIDDNGYLLFDKMNNFEWDPDKCMFEVIVAIRREMKPDTVARACAAIPNGAKYSD